MDTNLDPHPLFGSKMDVDYIFDRADTIEFGRLFVEAKFQHGMNLNDFQTNFGRGRHDQIWAKVDSTKF